MSVQIAPEALRARVARILARAGSAPAEAAQVADNLVLGKIQLAAAGVALVMAVKPTSPTA